MARLMRLALGAAFRPTRLAIATTTRMGVQTTILARFMEDPPSAGASISEFLGLPDFSCVVDAAIAFGQHEFDRRPPARGFEEFGQRREAVRSELAFEILLSAPVLDIHDGYAF